MHLKRPFFAAWFVLISMLCPLVAEAAPLTYGLRTEFRSNLISAVGAAKIDATHVLLAYGYSSATYLVIGTTDGSTSISFGTAYQFSADQANVVSITMLSSTKAVILYDGASNRPTAIVATIDGSSLSFGTPVEVQDAEVAYGFHSVTVRPLDSTHVVMGYAYDTGETFDIYEDFSVPLYTYTTVIGTISGTDISLGTNADITDSIQADFDLTVLDSSRFMATYADNEISLYGIAGSVSGTSITYGSPVVFCETCQEGTSLDAIDSTRVFLAYRESHGHGSLIIASVTGTDITFGTPNKFNDSLSFNFATAVLDSTHAVAGFYNITSESVSKSILVSISGTTPTVTDTSTFYAGQIDRSSVVALTNDTILFAYRPGNHSYRGSVTIGTNHVAVSTSSSSSSVSDQPRQSVGGSRGNSTALILQAMQNRHKSAPATSSVSSSSAATASTQDSSQKVRTCQRVMKWFGGNESAMNRVNARLEKWFGFRC